MFLSAAEIKCGIELLAQQLEAGVSRREVISEDMVLEILGDSHVFCLGHSSEEFIFAVLDVRFDTTDLHQFESTTCKTQVQFHTGQGQSMLRYWSFSYSYPFQQ
uniref:Uncharacterized protein n=1 Tax=Salix viminalis TaxID=40686 RepID=A0A6N2NEB1_SALVM